MNSRRYLMFLSYLGSGFRGSQFQRDLETVQNSIEVGLKSIFELSGERPIRIRLSSRTDTGVHALKAALITDLPPFNNRFMNPSIVMRKLNKYFSESEPIRISSVYCVDLSFPDFYSLLLDKTYLYRVGLLKKEFYSEIDRNLQPISEIQRTQIIRHKGDFNVRKAQEAAVLFEGSKDFGAVLGKPSQNNTKPTACNIMSFKIEEAQPLVPWDPFSQKFDYYHFICKGNRFLYHMVRRMVTLTLSVGYGRVSLNSIQNLFEFPVPSSWPKHTISTVSGSGLYLVDINVDMEKVKLSIIDEK